MGVNNALSQKFCGGGYFVNIQFVTKNLVTQNINYHEKTIPIFGSCGHSVVRL